MGFDSPDATPDDPTDQLGVARPPHQVRSDHDHRHVTGAREHELLGFVLEPEQHFGVPDRHHPGAEEPLDLRVERKQAQRVGHGRAALADAFADLFLREVKIAHEARVTVRLLDRVQVGALEVLDKCKRQECPVVEVLHYGGNRRPAERCNGAKATLAGDELEMIAYRADGHGLQEPGRRNACL